MIVSTFVTQGQNAREMTNLPSSSSPLSFSFEFEALLLSHHITNTTNTTTFYHNTTTFYHNTTTTQPPSTTTQPPLSKHFFFFFFKFLRTLFWVGSYTYVYRSNTNFRFCADKLITTTIYFFSEM